MAKTGATVKFYNHGGRCLEQIKKAGIESVNLKPTITQEQDKIIMSIDQYRAPLGTSLPFSEEELTTMVEADLEALDQFKPSGVYCGLSLSTIIAAKHAGYPMVTQVPTSLCPAFYRKGLASFPATMERNFIVRFLIPQFLKRRFFNAVMQKDVLKKTAAVFNRVRRRYGLSPIYNMVDFAKSDLVLLPDLPELIGLPAEDLPEGYHFVGPIFAHLDFPVPDEVRKIYSRPGVRVFYSLGSSGSPEVLKILAQTLREQAGLNTVCITTSIMRPEELGPATANFVAFSYLPAHLVNRMADVAVTHGGQGTLQTAVWAGTPVVGIGFQAEQQANIDGLARAGMAVRIPLYSVNKKRLLRAIEVIQQPSYRAKALEMRNLVRAHDGVAESVRLMNKLVVSR
jgi:UDP:flavonoid glycosyltransferase YjiC (YdhE family)